MASVACTLAADVSLRESPRYAAGAGPHLPVGTYSGAQYRAVLRFTAPSWTGWTVVSKATLTVKVSDHQHVAPTSATVTVKRGTWTKAEGSQNCNNGYSSSNTSQWGDVSGVSGSEASFSVTNSANVTKTVDVTTSVRAYFNAKSSTIVFVLDASSGYTEFWSREQGSSKPTLTIEYETNSVPVAPTLTAPAAGVVSTTRTPTFSWTHSDPQGDGQTAAEVEVSTSTGTVVGTQHVTGAGASVVWATALSWGTAYRFRVRTSDTAGYGPWSDYRAFTTASLPNVPAITAPAEGSVQTGLRPVITWTHSQPNGYAQSSAEVEVSTSAGVVVSTQTVSGTTATLTWPTDLVRGTAYRVRVRTASANVGFGAWSGYRAFTIASLPSAPTISAPTANLISTPQRPVITWKHAQVNGYAQSSAEVEVSTSAGVVVSTQTVTGATATLTWPSDLTRGSSYRVRVRTASSVVGFGPWSGYVAFSIAALVVVTISSKKLEWNATVGGPRVRIDWTNALPSGRTQTKYRVTWAGFDSGWVVSAATYVQAPAFVPVDNATLTVTVQVEDNLGLQSAVASTTFKTRFGMAVYRKDLGKVPVAWGTPSVTATVPAGSSVNIQYGSNGASAATAPSAWYSALSAVPKAQYLFYRVWLLPTPGGVSPSLDKIVVPFTDTKPALDFWYGNQSGGALPPQWSIDESEYVYGSRTITCEVAAGGPWVVFSNKIVLKKDHTYILSGLMRSEGNSGAQIRIADASNSTILDHTGKPVATDPITDTRDWMDPIAEDVVRYSTQPFTAPADMDTWVVLRASGDAGSQAWFDAIKLEESTVATPWQPGQLGAAVLDAGGVQIDGVKGGVFRYRGRDGNPMDVVEGGRRGLLIGGETELFSPSGGLIVARDVGQYPSSYMAGGQFVSSGARTGLGTSGSTANQWGKVAGGVLRNQYHGVYAVLAAMSVGSAGSGSSAAVINLHITQQAALGSAPYVFLRVNGASFSPNHWVVIINTFPTYTEWSLWVKTTRAWEYVATTPLMMSVSEAVNWEDLGQPSWQAALPSGTQHVGSQWDTAGIIVFATIASRDAYLPTPMAGTVVFVSETNSLWAYRSGAWAEVLSTNGTNSMPATEWPLAADILGGDTSSPVIGNGAISSYYAKTGAVHQAALNIAFGSTSTYGGGSWWVKLPKACGGNSTIIGHGYYATGSGTTPLAFNVLKLDSNRGRLVTPTGTYIGSTTGFTSGGILRVFFTYF